jgi:hypothetical protein
MPSQKRVAFVCPHCQRNGLVRSELAGKKIKCPNPECGKRLVVPVVDPGAVDHIGWTPNASALSETTPVHSKPDGQAPVLAHIAAGEEFRLGQLVNAGVAWVEVTFRDGRNGYILGTTEVFSFKNVVLVDAEIDIHQMPSESPSPVDHLVKGDVLVLIGAAKHVGREWVRVRAPSGRIGFMAGNTRVDALPSCPLCNSLHAGKPLARIAAIFLPTFVVMMILEIVVLTLLIPFINSKLSLSGLQLTSAGMLVVVFFVVALPFMIGISIAIGMRKCGKCGARWFDVHYLTGPPGG